jgi:gliding motility-associated protein GldM
MAHEKLSPRQKMIGMMYLVLTAMLALNVSKDAVEAFKKVDNSLQLTVKNYELKNNVIYADFDRAAAENPTKAGKYRDQAYQVKQRADELFDYLHGIKVTIIKEAEGEDTDALRGDLVITDSIRKIDENNIPSQILIGSNEDGLAFGLKSLINEYRTFLVNDILEGKNQVAEAAILNSLNTDDGVDAAGDPASWEIYTWYHLPLVACVTILSKIQVDVRNAETEVLNHLYSQIDASSFKFNKLNAIVIPKSNYVTLGSNYEATVFISATDTTQQPNITVGEMQLPMDEAGKGLYSVKATTLGPRTWGGIISLKSPDGSVKTYPFSESYSVGEPNVICSPTAMNVMYAGIENPLDVSVPGVDPQDIKVRVVNGSYSVKKVRNPRGEFFRGNWAIKPEQIGKNVQVVVSTDIDGKVTNYAPYEFRVKPIPDPEAQFGGKSSGTISRAVAVAQQGVFAVLRDFDFDLIYEITGFTMIYTDRMGDIESRSTSSTLTADQKTILNRLTRGKTLIITDIKAKGPDGEKDLKPVVLKID